MFYLNEVWLANFRPFYVDFGIDDASLLFIRLDRLLKFSGSLLQLISNITLNNFWTYSDKLCLRAYHTKKINMVSIECILMNFKSLKL